MDKLDKVVATYLIKCRGIVGENSTEDSEARRYNPLTIRNAVDVIAVVHQFGHAEPLCNFRSGGICMASGKPKIWGECMYFRPKSPSAKSS